MLSRCGRGENQMENNWTLHRPCKYFLNCCWQRSEWLLFCFQLYVMTHIICNQWRTEGGWGVQTLPSPEIPKLSRIPSFVENTSVHKPNQNTGFTHLQIEWNPWLGGYSPQIPVLSAPCPQLNLLNPHTREKIPDVTPHPPKNSRVRQYFTLFWIFVIISK
jgi:hypothetical protein